MVRTKKRVARFAAPGKIRGILGGLLLATMLCFSTVPEAVASSVGLELGRAVRMAQQNDPWLVENRHSQDAVEAQGIKAGTYPDPTVSLGFANLPTDTFNFDQEPMTQFRVGVTQMMPRGDSLAIKQKQLQTLGKQFPQQRRDRLAQTAVIVGQLWLDAFKAQESVALIEEDRPLFEQLADVAEASYSSALGMTRQQDIVRASLELTRLEDRLTMLRQRQEVFLEKLFGWMQGSFGAEYLPAGKEIVDDRPVSYDLDRNLHTVNRLNIELYSDPGKHDPAKLYEYFSSHPAVMALEKKIEASRLGVDLARESYKPMWGVNMAYGYRDETPASGELADFFSLGVSFDLPVFTKNRQDKDVQAAVSQAEAIKTRKWMLVRNMIAEFEKNRAQLQRLTQRQKLYRDQLLPQMHEQAEASLTAYTNDDGDFAEVVRARIAELNARIDSLDIDVEKQKTIIRLNYFLMNDADEIVATRSVK